MQPYYFLPAITSLASIVISYTHLPEVTEVWAPLPPLAQGDPIGDGGYALEDFGGGVHMITEGGYQSLIVVSTEGVILVDAPPSIGSSIGYAVGNLTTSPITHIVYSHHHSDHIGATYLYNSTGVEIIAQEITKTNLEAVPHPTRPLPTITFRDNYTLCVANQTLELSYKGENHEPGNIFIYHPTQKVLMLVDIIVPGWVPFAQLSLTTNVPGYIAAHDQVLAYDFAHYVGGHPGRSGNRTDVERQKEYVNDLFHNCQDAFGLIQTNNSVLGSQALLTRTEMLNPGNFYAPAKLVNDITAEYSANVTNEKWLGVLGGADTFGFENAYAIVTALQIDYA